MLERIPGNMFLITFGACWAANIGESIAYLDEWSLEKFTVGERRSLSAETPQSILTFSSEVDLPARNNFAVFPIMLSVEVAIRHTPRPTRAMVSHTAEDAVEPMPKLKTRSGRFDDDEETASCTISCTSCKSLPT